MLKGESVIAGRGSSASLLMDLAAYTEWERFGTFRSRGWTRSGSTPGVHWSPNSQVSMTWVRRPSGEAAPAPAKPADSQTMHRSAVTCEIWPGTTPDIIDMPVRDG